MWFAAAALERLGYPAEADRVVELSSAAPRAPYSSRIEQALGVSDPEEVAAVSARVGERTLVYEIHGVQQDESALCVGGMSAAGKNPVRNQEALVTAHRLALLT